MKNLYLNQVGLVSPKEYDWKKQFSTINPCGDFIEMDTGKVCGLAEYANKLEQQVAELREMLVWNKLLRPT